MLLSVGGCLTPVCSRDRHRWRPTRDAEHEPGGDLAAPDLEMALYRSKEGHSLGASRVGLCVRQRSSPMPPTLELHQRADGRNSIQIMAKRPYRCAVHRQVWRSSDHVRHGPKVLVAGQATAARLRYRVDYQARRGSAAVTLPSILLSLLSCEAEHRRANKHPAPTQVVRATRDAVMLWGSRCNSGRLSCFGSGLLA